MRKVKLVKFIVKLYFIGSVSASFTHLQHAAVKLGGHGWETWAAPVAIDLMFIIAMVLRSEDFSTDTRRIGFRLMLGMGSISLAGNIYAGNSAFGWMFGALLPVCLLLSEWLITRIKTRKQELAEQAAIEQAAAVAEAERIAQAEARRLAAEAAAQADRLAREAEARRLAEAAANAWRARCTHPTACVTETQCATKTEATVKASRTRKRAERQRAAQERALEALVAA